MTRPKLAEQAQRVTAVLVLDRMSDIFLELLRYDEPQNGGQSIDLHLYWYCVVNFIHNILGGGIYLDGIY